MVHFAIPAQRGQAQEPGSELTVFLVTIVLYLFGGAVINDFAFCMLVGVISGTYSTIYQASALIVVYEKFFGKKKTQPVKAKVGNQKVS